MKYKILTQISQFLANFHKISSIKRVGDNAICINFDGKIELIFDLENSSIYTAKIVPTKEYKAPFDIVLKKRLNSAKISEISTLENNRILKISTSLSGSYKMVKSVLFLEFTGRFTNAILTDENGVIVESLRHCVSKIRTIKVGKILTALPQIEIKEQPSPVISDFTAFFAEEFSNIMEKKLTTLKTAKIANLDRKIESLNRILSSLESSENLAKRGEILNKNGSLIIANLHLLNDFDRDLNLKDQNGKTINIKIDAPPKIAANSMFAQSKKCRQKAKNIAIQAQNLKSKIEFLSKLKNAINLAQNSGEIEILTPKNTQKQSQNSSDFIQNFYIGAFKISVGKNEKGNEMLLKNAKKDDFWFHLQNVPSSHIIVKTNKQNLSDEIVKIAAKLCASFSVNAGGNYLIDYTKRQNVKIKEKAFVNYTNYKTISVKI